MNRMFGRFGGAFMRGLRSDGSPASTRGDMLTPTQFTDLIPTRE
jgi:hypothetical protein